MGYIGHEKRGFQEKMQVSRKVYYYGHMKFSFNAGILRKMNT